MIAPAGMVSPRRARAPTAPPSTAKSYRPTAGFAPPRPGPEAPIFRAPGMTAMNSPQVREGEPARGLPSGRKGLEPRDHGERLGPVEDRRDTHVGANGELALGEARRSAEHTTEHQ